MASLPPSQLFSYQNRNALDDLFLNACDSTGTVRKPRIPAELLYKPFQVFLEEASHPLESRDDPRFHIPQNDPNVDVFFQDVVDLMTILAGRFSSETLLTEVLSPKFQSILGVGMGRALTPRGSCEREGNADGAYMATGIGRPACIVLREDTLGSGSGGGDSLVELLGHYANILLYTQPPPPSPTVFVEVVGPRLVISLAACDDPSRPAVSPAVLSHSLIFQANPTVQISSLAATLIALRRLVTTMTFEKNAFPPPLLTDATRFGYNLVFQHPHGLFHKYLRAEERYGEDAHTWCAAQGYAPSFVSVNVCPTWRRIEMTTAHTTTEQWVSAYGITDPDTRQAILTMIREVLGKMHNAGFVHGDVRAGNTLVLRNVANDNDNDDLRVMLIDFDSSGRATSARYSILPFAIPYAPTARPGGLVTAEHDNWRVASIDRFFT